MENEFRSVEESFRLLKRKFRMKEISQKEFIDQLKSLRIKDEEGRFWMIGAQTGKWYYFNGKDWTQSEPPSLDEKKAICIYCGFENDLTAEFCSRCGSAFKEKEAPVCPDCGRQLEEPGQACPSCSPKAGEAGPSVTPLFLAEGLAGKRKGTYAFRAVHPVSFTLFSGILGIFLGVVVGAFLGATDVLPSIGNAVPPFLNELRGKLMGGILFSGLGGIVGFLFLAGFGFLQAVIFNSISSFIGGIKIRLDETNEEPIGQKVEDKRDRFLSLK
jgi:hypothetical protein